MPSRSLCALLGAIALLGLAAPSHAQAPAAPAEPAPPPAVAAAAPRAEPQRERLKVADPYLELRTGAGRGYPVFHVAERGEWVELLMRSTDWYLVRSANGREGWVHRRQLEATLTEAGERKSFRDVLIDDYLQRRVQVGAAYGRFKGEPMMKLFGNYRLSSTLSLEATAAQVQGVFSGTDFWHLDLQLEPWSERRLSPFFGVGVGQFRNVPNRTLIGALTTRAQLYHAGVGLRWYLSDRFLLRADWGVHTATVSDGRSDEYKGLSAGLAFFF